MRLQLKHPPLALLVYLCAAIFLAACSGQEQSKALASLTLTPCERDQDTGVPPVVGGAECGYLQLAENPADPDSPMIDVHIMRWPAISAVGDEDPLFVIAGGPGQAASGIANQLVQAFFNIRKNRDIIFVDQRGTGKSNALHCDEDDEAFSLLEYSGLTNERAQKNIARCAEKYTDNAQFYTTYYAVDDLEAVRKALGYDRINLWGGSYGTRVVLTYMAEYPQALRSVVMDGLAPVAIALPNTISRDAQQAFTRVAEQCQNLPACYQRYGDIADKAQRLAQRFAEQPVRLEIPHPLTAVTTDILLDEGKLAALVRLSLYDRLLARLIPHTIAEAEAGRYDTLAALVAQLFERTQLPDLAFAMHLSIICNEDAESATARVDEEFLGVDLAAPMRDFCEIWPKAPIAERYYEPVSSAIPALLLSGTRDPVTPPKWGETVMETLINGHHLVAHGAHHGVTLQGCTADVITRFIRDTQVDTEQAQCIDNIAPLLPYIAPGTGDDNKPEENSRD